MRKIKNVFCVILSMMLLVLVLVTPVAAAEKVKEDAVNPRFSVINSCSVSLDISGLTATVSTSLTASYSTSLSIKIELQKETSTGYETVKTWTKAGNGISLTLVEDRLINVFATYRAKVTFTAGGETTTMFKY